MSDTGFDEKIVASFALISDAYKQVEKLRVDLVEKGRSGERFIHFNEEYIKRSIASAPGWAYGGFIMIFHDNFHLKRNDFWREGPVYGMEINLDEYEEAFVFVTRFDFADTSDIWSKTEIVDGPADLSYFYDPLRDENMVDDEDTCEYHNNFDKDCYHSLKKVRGRWIPLSSVTEGDSCGRIFEEFARLAELP